MSDTHPPRVLVMVDHRGQTLARKLDDWDDRPALAWADITGIGMGDTPAPFADGEPAPKMAPVEYVPAARITELEQQLTETTAEAAALRQQLHEAQTAIRTLVGDGHILTEIRDGVRRLLQPLPAAECVAEPAPRPQIQPKCVERVGQLGVYCGQLVGQRGYLRLRCDEHVAAADVTRKDAS